ncbi:CB1 cannabinoid receptor-interacting protein 1-like [Panonychus citri]|uniref:CB1 cannabinoid receptor-interacting protein 1-like n=1 Tax=Panonychus citri TaxID=50023 RepID=UPI0023076C95|nr:CB1 cannabinoid receptor-interacting protein 1-like [Panonychus citri]
MGESRNNFKIMLFIRSANDNDIFFKRDGRRFESENTIKLLVEANYNFTITIKPSLPLQSVSVSGVGVSVTDLSQQETEGSKYTFSWGSIKVNPNKKKDRTTVQLLFQFQDGLTLVLPLQVKFYRPEETDHLIWGSPLNHIEYNCIVKPGQTYVDIVKEIFR